MRKSILAPSNADPPEPVWLDVERLARVEVSSEDPAYPVEEALRAAGTTGWRASESGPQTVRLRFDEPQYLKRIRVQFQEAERARSQEFVLRWSADGGRTYREIVRQQYNFSPPDTAREVEDYAVTLEGVTALELQIVPDVSGGEARASLSEWTLG
jgi:uncharacterized protein (DUF736 family)